MVRLYGQDKLISIKMNLSLTRFLLHFFRRFWEPPVYFISEFYATSSRELITFRANFSVSNMENSDVAKRSPSDRSTKNVGLNWCRAACTFLSSSRQPPTAPKPKHLSWIVRDLRN